MTGMGGNGVRPEHRVVVTGMGVLAPNGNNLAEFWDSLIEGRSGLGIATSFDVSDLPVKTVAELKNFDPRNYMDFKEAKRMARFSQVGVAAAKMAIDQSGLELVKEDRTRIGCELGTGIGGFKEISEEIEAFALRGGARPGPRGGDLWRDHRVRRDRRRLSHRDAGRGWGWSRPRHGKSARGCPHRSPGGRLHQRPRDLDPAQR